MKKKGMILFTVMIGCSLLAGCVGPRRVESDYGTSVKLAKANQVLDPEAENNLDPVLGLDSFSALHTLERHRRDFDRPSPAPTYIFNVGGTAR